MEKKSILEITIFDKKLNIKSEEEDIEYLKEIADFVNESMNNIAGHYDKNFPKDIIAILTCLNIADSLKREIAKNKAEKDTMTALKETIAMRSSELIELIDNNIEN